MYKNFHWQFCLILIRFDPFSLSIMQGQMVINGQLTNAYQEYADTLLKYCSQKMRNVEDAKEVVHDAFVQAHGYLSRGKTVEDLNSFLFRIANNLISLGFKKGDRVAFLSKNCAAYMQLYFAVGKIGGISVPVNWRLKDEELVYILNDSIPRGLFFSQEYLPLITTLKPNF